jgi:hypothetical protein
MKRGVLVLLMLVLLCSFVSGKIVENDDQYARQQYYPGYVLVDGEKFYDECREQDFFDPDDVNDVILGYGDADGETYQRYLSMTQEWVYSIDDSFESGSDKYYYLQEYCSDYDVCEGLDGDFLHEVVRDGELFYYTDVYCQYGCAFNEDGAYCITRQDKSEVNEDVDDANPVLGCGESDSQLQKYVPAFSRHVTLGKTHEYVDNCDGSVLNEACCGRDCGDRSYTNKLHKSQKDCDYGCVYVPGAPDFCAKEEWTECYQDSQCVTFYDCVDGKCVESEVEGNRVVDESALDTPCGFFGCDCDGDDDLSNEKHYYRSGDSVTALSQSLCNAEPGTTVDGNDAWCTERAGEWFPVASSSEEECYVGSVPVRTTSFSRAPSKDVFFDLFNRIKAIF